MRDVTKAYKAAISHANRLGYCSLADDFASWLAVRLLEGGYQNQPIKFALVDFLRQTQGSVDRSKAKYEERRKTLHMHGEEDMLPSQDLSADNKLELKRIIQNNCSLEDGKMICLYYFEGLSLKEIANLYGITESGAYYKLSDALDRTRRATGIKLKGKRIKIKRTL